MDNGYLLSLHHSERGHFVSRRRIGVCLATLAVALTWAIPAAARHTAVRVAVTAGKPSEFRFKLSTQSVHRGTVLFTVVNGGTVAHDFKINGKKTPLLQPGKSAILNVVFKKPGRYRYLCTVPGHAAAGMKGILKVS
jgi:uncharacterized cupredoxin-like copper-binding protein